MTINGKEYIYKVAFFEPPFADFSTREFYFGSVTAIYNRFTPAQIGCNVNNLWNLRVNDGVPYCSKTCRITRHEVTRQKQKHPRSKSD